VNVKQIQNVGRGNRSADIVLSVVRHAICLFVAVCACATTYSQEPDVGISSRTTRAPTETESSNPPSGKWVGLALDPRGNWLATREHGAIITFRDVTTLKPIDTIDVAPEEVGGVIRDIALSCDGTTLACVEGYRESLHVWQYRDGWKRVGSVERYPGHSAPTAMAIVPKTSIVAIADMWATIEFWDVSAVPFKQRSRISLLDDESPDVERRGPRGVDSMVFNREGTLLTTHQASGEPKVWHGEKITWRLGQVLPSDPTESAVIDLSPDGKMLAVGYNGFFRIDGNQAKPERFLGIKEPGKFVSFSSDGSLFAMTDYFSEGPWDGRFRVRIWELDKTPAVEKVIDHVDDGGVITRIAFIPGRKWLAIMFDGDPRHIAIWDVGGERPKLVRSL